MGQSVKKFVFILAVIVGMHYSVGQQKVVNPLKRINELIEVDSLDAAQSKLTTQVVLLKTSKNFDSLVSYIFPTGRIEIFKKNSITSALTLAEEIKVVNNNYNVQCKIKSELAKLHFELGEISAAFELAKEAKEFAKKTSDETLLINSEYLIGDYALRSGNIEALEEHIRSAHTRILKKEGQPYPITARVLNLMGAVMFFSTKQDSAQYYFESALKHIPSLEDNVENKLYLPAAISGNLFVITLNKGEHHLATKYAENSLRLNQEFLNKAPNHRQVPRVKRNLALGYINLSSLHFDLGDFDRSDNIMAVAHNFAKKNFDLNTDEYFYVVLGIAEIKNAKKEFSEATSYLKIAENSLNAMTSDNPQLRAYLYNNLGNSANGLKDYKKALAYYEKSDINHEKFNPGQYDSNRLYQSMNQASLHAKLGQKEKALSKIQRTYNYIVNENGPENYQANVLLVSLAQINYDLEDYEEVLKWCNKSLEIYKKNEKLKGFDKLYFEEKKAQVLLLNAKAKYAMEQEKDTVVIKNLLADLNQAIQTLEARKSIISTPEAVTVLIEDNKDVFDFAKKLNLELFAISQNTDYLNQAVSLHESAIYNRIRVRLNINDAISFSGIPSTILTRENKLRNALDIDPEKESDNALNNLLESKAIWAAFLDSIQQAYPKYHKMRYATIGESLENIQQKIPEKTTAVRYFFVEDLLYAYVISEGIEKLIPLNYADVEELISQLGEDQSDLTNIANTLNSLYEKLWKPLENQIQTKNIIIFPDGVLYNLSFETLTSTKITSFKELSTNSLLAKHNISYNYSLYLLDSDKKSKVYDNSFVAFAPEFNDAMKENYKIAVTDSLRLDKTYLKLLQQPFNVSLAKAYGNLFNGSYFINENSTEQIFKSNANEHKIIHIGTHAESNNISPELSRLIFAKDVSNSSGEDGSLYTYEIYNTSLNSNLAILTACETGKPSYQAGEGMISLAHAFNYAGSESILTSLWKIDERSSAEIIESFYDNIKSGKPKDEALRLAKLDYIQSTDGRTLAPQFWAGLVLMGDTSPIEISNTTNWMYWVLAIVLSLLLMVFLKNRFRSS